MKLFTLIQDQDTIIAEGVVFSNGQCAVNWLNTNMSFFYDNEEHIIKAHSNDNLLNIRYLTDDKSQYIENKFSECYMNDSNKMCKTCQCWKMTRVQCS
jgi:hypothetical protein